MSYSVQIATEMADLTTFLHEVALKFSLFSHGMACLTMERGSI